ncbi:MAG: endonuclease MutS2, partial [Abditibacteriota bacterium]|nr:endonuclease MutS2 [Abditibacteriota bacterium]
MNQHSLKVLEFDKILALCAERASTELGAAAIGGITPEHNVSLLRRELEKVRELREIIALEGGIPFRAVYDVRSSLAAAEVGSCMSIPEIQKTAETLVSLKLLHSFFKARGDKYPACSRIADYEVFPELTELVERSVAPDGSILDSASDTLRLLRNEIKTLDGRIKEKISGIISSSKYRSYLQEPIITTRSDRYCIPVKAEYKSQVLGIVHDSSGSGSTLYIEPGVIVDLGNRLRDTQAKERDEIQKILYNISGRLGERCREISFAIDCATELDVVYAKALLAADFNCAEPKLNEKGRISVREARHLLLPKETAVPIDVSLGIRSSCLLITGPNTGGKTVTLKTVGTIVLMAMCGMFVPAAENSEVSVFTEIYADIGDEQSIEQSLSTFSGHVKNIVEITRNVTGRCLVLLDELGAGTDPVEGAALAQSILIYLLDRKARIIATSHYGELKQFAFSDERVENASVEFDTNTLKPTYKLLIGVPGSSNALLIASRMGIPAVITDKARETAAREESASGELIRRIEDVQREAAADRLEAAKRLKELEELKAKQQRELEELRRRQQNAEDKARKRANKIIQKFSDEIDFNLALLKETTSEDKDRQQIRKELNRLMDDFKKETAKTEVPKLAEPPRPKAENLQPGDAVHVISLGQNGYVESVSGQNAVISINNKKITVRKDNLAQVKTSELAQPRQSVTYTVTGAFRPEINLIGMRADEALLNLEKYLDKA